MHQRLHRDKLILVAMHEQYRGAADDLPANFRLDVFGITSMPE